MSETPYEMQWDNNLNLLNVLRAQFGLTCDSCEN